MNNDEYSSLAVWEWRVAGVHAIFMLCFLLQSTSWSLSDGIPGHAGVRFRQEMTSKSRQIHASCAMSSALGDCLDMTSQHVATLKQIVTVAIPLHVACLISPLILSVFHVAQTFLHRVQASRRLRTTEKKWNKFQDSCQ